MGTVQELRDKLGLPPNPQDTSSGLTTVGELKQRLKADTGQTTVGELKQRIFPKPETVAAPPPAAPLIPQPGTPDLGTRLGESIREGIRPNEPLGPSEESLKPLRDIGFIRKTTQDRPEIGNLESFLSIPRTFNEIILRDTGTVLDLTFRGIEASFNAVTTAVGSVAQTLGLVGDETDRHKFENDVRGLIDSAAIVMGSSPSVVARRPSPRIRRAVDDQVEALIEKNFPETDIVAKAALKEEAVAIVQQGLDDVLLQQARDRIGQKTLGAVKEEARFTFTDKAYAATLDQLQPIKALAEQEGKRRGVPPDLVPYNDMRLVAGVDGVIESVFKKGTIALDKAGDVTFRGKPFNDVFAKVADDLDNVALYFAGRRAQELTAPGRGLEVPFSADEIGAMVRLGEKNPFIKKAFDDWIQFNNEILDFAEQSGVLSAEQKARFQEAGKSYVPYYRIVADGSEKGRVQGSPLSRLKGGKSNLNEIMDNLTRNTVMWIDLSVKNKAKQSVYKMIEDYGLDDVAQRLSNMPERGVLADRKIEEALIEMGMKNPGDAVSVFTAPRLLADNVDSVFINGKRVLYEIKDPVFLKAVTAYRPQSFNLAMRVISGFSNVLRRGVTLSPDFMARNLIRDTQAAFLQSQGGQIPFIDALRGISSRIMRDDNYWEMMANGGGFATLYKGETANVNNLRALYTKHGIDANKVLDSARKLKDGLEEISSSFEQASRISEYRSVRGSGGSKRAAALSSRDVSTDFALRGASDTIKTIAASVPFLNARAQGLSRLVKEAKNNPAKLALKATLAMTVPSVALYSINKDDNRYKALADWVRDMHWVVFVPGSDDPFLIPKGFEYGALFATMPERFVEGLEQKHGKAFAAAFGRMFTDTFAVNFPQVVKPVFEGGLPTMESAGMNRRFSGAPVVPADLQDVRLSEQYRPWTSETMIALSQAMRLETGIEMSPLKAENLVIGYLGTLGMYALSVSDMMVRQATGKTAPETRLDEVPLLRAFMRQTPQRGTQFEKDFYDLLGDARMVSATVTKMVNEGRNPDMTKREERLFGLRKALDKVAAVASSVSRSMRLIQDSPDLSPKEKRRQLDDLQTRRNELFFQFQSSLAQDQKDLLLERGATIPAPVNPSPQSSVLQ